MTLALPTLTLLAALAASPVEGALEGSSEDITPAPKTASDAALPNLATTLAFIQSEVNALQRFKLQVEFSTAGEANEIAYVERIPSRIAIDTARCVLSYVDQRAREPAWSFVDVDKVEVQTDIAFHDDSDARTGETRREISASPTSYMLVVTMKPGKGWPVHAWGVADAVAARRIATAMTRAAALCSTGGGSTPGQATPSPTAAVRRP